MNSYEITDHVYDVVVVGAGGVGLSAVMGAQLAGAERIISVDRELAKESLSKELGATEFIYAGEQAIEEVLTITQGRGADVVIEAVGVPALQESWLAAVRRGGTFVYVGIPSETDVTKFFTADFIRSEKSIKGSYYAAMDSALAIDQLCAAYLEGRLPVDKLITKRIALENIQVGLFCVQKCIVFIRK